MTLNSPPQETITDQSGVVVRGWRTWFYGIFSAISGKLDAPYTVTLLPGTTSTPVPNKFCNSGSQIILSAITATAAASTGLYTVSGRETFTIHHNNTADADKTFRYAIVG